MLRSVLETVLVALGAGSLMGFLDANPPRSTAYTRPAATRRAAPSSSAGDGPQEPQPRRRCKRDPFIDFGVARHLDLDSLTATAAPGGCGTIGYAPAEQCRNDKPDIDARADLFALGVTL
jgi:hypothetical protein